MLWALINLKTSNLMPSQPLLTESANELEVVVMTRSVFLASLASESVALRADCLSCIPGIRLL